MKATIAFVIAFLAGLMGLTYKLAAYGPRAYDSSGMIRAAAAGNLTATETIPASTGLTIQGTPIGGVTFRLHVPAFVAASTLDVKIQHSTDGSTWTDLTFFPQVNAAAQIGELRRRVATANKFIRAVLTVAGGGANFGVVQLGADTGGEQASW